MNKNQFPRRAAEASTSEQSVCRLPSHASDMLAARQLAARGLAPRKIHSIADCSVNVLPCHLRWFCGLFGDSRSQFERKSVDGCECAMDVSVGSRTLGNTWTDR